MRIQIQNARLAFPNLWVARPGLDGGDPAFSASLIIPKNHPVVAKLKEGFKAVAKEKWGPKADAILKNLEATDRLALHDGDLKSQYAGFEGNLFVSARGKTRPTVLGRNREPLVAEDGKPYAGCYVNASIELWPQDHPKFGKRINAQLRGVQFVMDGDAFAAGTAASEDEFEDLGDQGDDPTA